MLIDLYDLLQEEGGQKDVSLRLSTDKFELDNIAHPVKECNVKCLFVNNGKKHISFKAKGHVVLEMPCDNCLTPVDVRINVDYFKDLDMNKSDEERALELDDEGYLSKTTVDLDVFIHNEILVNLPMKVLCRTDCKGICNRCGMNLNKGTCECNKEAPDPRMSKILEIFNQFKEV